MKTIKAYQCANCGALNSTDTVCLEVHFHIELHLGYRTHEVHEDYRYGDGQTFCSWACAGEWLKSQAVSMPEEKKPEPEVEPATPPPAPAEDLVSVLKDIAADAAKPEVVF